MSLTVEQRESRKHALTSSDAFALLHPECWETLANDIIAGRPEKEDTPAMQRGRDQEGPICDAAAVLKGWSIFECETVHHATVPYLLCHPDRIIVGPDPGAMEAKCPANAFIAQRYYEQWMCQVHFHLLCTGYTWGALVVGYGDWAKGAVDLRVVPVQRNERLMVTMEELAWQFWTYLQETRDAKRTNW